MNEKEFKKNYRFPFCNHSPIEFLIPFSERKETLLKIKNEVIDIYGEDISSECPRRKVCVGKNCLERPLFWKSKTAYPYLKELSKRLNIKEDNNLVVKGCLQCPIKATCQTSCSTVNDFVLKNKTEEPKLLYYSEYPENKMELLSEEIERNDINLVSNIDIPWDVLSNIKIDVIKTYLYEQRDFQYISDKYKLSNAAYTKYLFYSSLNKLSEYGVFRKFISDNYDQLTYKQYCILNAIYNENKSLTEVSREFKISKAAVSHMVARIIKTYNIKIQKFVTKKNNKLIYNVTELFK